MPLIIFNSNPPKSKTFTGAAADGGNTAITFDTPFNSGTTSVNITVSNYSGSDNAALYCDIVGVPSRTGFTATVGGGQSGTTCDIQYTAYGT